MRFIAFHWDFEALVLKGKVNRVFVLPLHYIMVCYNRARSLPTNCYIMRERSRTVNPLLTGRAGYIIMRPMKKRKDPHAVALGRKGGKKGGPARAAKLSMEERKASARKAANARWQRERKG